MKVYFCYLQRCVVVQEVFPDGLIAQDGRLRPGDQIIEINGVDMTCANHLQVNIAHFFQKVPKILPFFGTLLYILLLMCKMDNCVPVIKSLKLTEWT